MALTTFDIVAPSLDYVGSLVDIVIDYTVGGSMTDKVYRYLMNYATKTSSLLRYKKSLRPLKIMRIISYILANTYIDGVLVGVCYESNKKINYCTQCSCRGCKCYDDKPSGDNIHIIQPSVRNLSRN